MDDSGFTTPPPPPPPGAGGGGELPQRALGDILSTAFNIYKANAAQLLKIVALVVVPLTLFEALISNVVFKPTSTTLVFGSTTTTVSSRSTGSSYLVFVVGMLVALLIGAALQAAMLRAGAEATMGDKPDVDRSFRFGFRRIGSVILIGILVALVVMSVALVGVILAFAVPALGVIVVLVGIVWAVYAGTLLALSVSVLVVEGKTGQEALSRSWNLVKGHFWHALGTIVVASIITGVIGGLIGALGGSNWFASWIFGAIGQILVAPFSALVTIVLYLDIRSRSESLTSNTLRSEISAGE